MGSTIFTGKVADKEKIVTLDWRNPAPLWSRGGVISVGNFDGVHLGHRALIRQASELARSVGGPLSIVTFDPHPLQLLAPEHYQPPLTTVANRAELLQNVGADTVIILQTDKELLNLSPKEFFQQILVERFQARGIVEGFNFRFGRDRAGSVDTLREICDPLDVPFRVVQPFQLDGTVVSSSRVREALEEGDIRQATTLLDRLYTVEGAVIEGAKRGRTIGFPTANLGGVETLLPADGVYAVRVRCDSQVWAGAANIGPNPTFGENVRKIEVHLIDFQRDLYGQSIIVAFEDRLRPTRKFASVAELTSQMKNDIAKVRQIVKC